MTRALVVALALCLVACDRGDAIELGEWTLQYDGQEAYAETPGRLPLPDREVDWTLARDVEIPEAWRDQPLTLALPLYLGPALRVTIDGVQAPAIDREGTTCAFRLPASPATTRHLVIAGHHAHFFDAKIQAAPAISRTDRGDPAYVTRSTITRYSTSLTLGLLVMVTFVYLVSWVMDRRPADGWFGAQAAGGLGLVAVAFSFRAPAWPYLAQLSPLFGAISVATGAAFIRAYFSLAPLPRWVAALVPAACVLTIVAYLRPFEPIWWVLGLTTLPAGFACSMLLLSRAVRDPQHASDARLFAIAWVVTASTAVLDNLLTLGYPVIPVVTMPLALALYGFVQTFVVSRDRLRRTREAERLNVELRRQVADRSRELADALTGHTPSNVPIANGNIVEDRYKVIRQLGAGAMGAVYEVERISDGRRCALKVITMRATGDILARFAREAQLAATLDAPNLVAVIDVGMSRTLGLFLVMELVRGGSLEQQRARFGDGAWARPLCRQIAAGLAVMHAADVLHRDLKPANVLLDGGTAKIADFGLAGANARAPIDAEAATAAPQLTQVGAFLGTPLYMAPELARGAEHASPASDVFALGVLAHELLTGKPPFAEPAVILASRGTKLPAVDGVPEVIARALDGDPALRPSAVEVRDAMA